MEGPKYDEIRRNNRSVAKQEEDEERLYAELEELGVDCDECGDTYLLGDLEHKINSDLNNLLICKYCL